MIFIYSSLDVTGFISRNSSYTPYDECKARCHAHDENCLNTRNLCQLTTVNDSLLDARSILKIMYQRVWPKSL
jgi:hypothetical protein